MENKTVALVGIVLLAILIVVYVFSLSRPPQPLPPTEPVPPSSSPSSTFPIKEFVYNVNVSPFMQRLGIELIQNRDRMQNHVVVCYESTYYFNTAENATAFFDAVVENAAPSIISVQKRNNLTYLSLQDGSQTVCYMFNPEKRTITYWYGQNATAYWGCN